MKKLSFMTVESHLRHSNDAGISDCSDKRVCVCLSDKPDGQIEVFALHGMDLRFTDIVALSAQ